jgi:hypothetical protein
MICKIGELRLFPDDLKRLKVLPCQPILTLAKNITRLVGQAMNLLHQGTTMKKIVYIILVLLIYGLVWFAQASHAAVSPFSDNKSIHLPWERTIATVTCN